MIRRRGKGEEKENISVKGRRKRRKLNGNI